MRSHESYQTFCVEQCVRFVWIRCKISLKTYIVFVPGILLTQYIGPIIPMYAICFELNHLYTAYCVMWHVLYIIPEPEVIYVL